MIHKLINNYNIFFETIKTERSKFRFNIMSNKIIKEKYYRKKVKNNPNGIQQIR